VCEGRKYCSSQEVELRAGEVHVVVKQKASSAYRKDFDEVAKKNLEEAQVLKEKEAVEDLGVGRDGSRIGKTDRPMRTSVMSFMKSVWSSIIAQPSWRIVVGEDVSWTLKSRISLRRWQSVRRC
jgi:hypothetical protein